MYWWWTHLPHVSASEWHVLIILQSRYNALELGSRGKLYLFSLGHGHYQRDKQKMEYWSLVVKKFFQASTTLLLRKKHTHFPLPVHQVKGNCGKKQTGVSQELKSDSFIKGGHSHTLCTDTRNWVKILNWLFTAWPCPKSYLYPLTHTHAPQLYCTLRCQLKAPFDPKSWTCWIGFIPIMLA